MTNMGVGETSVTFQEDPYSKKYNGSKDECN